MTPTTNRQLAAAIAYVRDHALDDPALDPGGVLAATAARHLAAATLAALPHTGRSAHHRADSTEATPDTVRRALAYVDAHADRDIALADIAAAAYVTPRAPQYAFRRHLGTTPPGTPMPLL
ncbi:hypothetical protein ABZ747_35515 [Kitasatospora cineracea]|uniref:hypothetical protein n=1 Tax=Kitasatospora cineracea TaxID=88074 RepID=UPI0033D90885